MIIAKEKLQSVLNLWSNHYDVYAPMKKDDNTLLMPYNPEVPEITLDYINFNLPVKEYLFEQKEELFSWKKDGENLSITKPQDRPNKKRILFGVRACDAYGIAYMDHFYLDEFKDDNYESRRNQTLVVALNCVKSGPNCFCPSMGVGPFATAGYDVVLTPLEDAYLVEAATEEGETLLEMLSSLREESSAADFEQKETLEKETVGKFTSKINKVEHLSEALMSEMDNPLWEEISKRCILCTGCTNVCPTCTCFNVVEENKDACSGCRVRYWDSCQSDSFTRNAGNHNPRNKVARVRYRIYDKLKYIEDRFNMKGCTGCGRCIEACPVFINIVNSANHTIEEHLAHQLPTQVEAPRYEKGGCTNKCEEVYLPQIAIIKDIIQETRDIKRFILQFEDKSLHEKFEFSGQFFEITVFGAGEIAISIPFSPSQRDYFDFCVKKAGKVTTALHNMKVGDKVGLRGPFGTGFPYEEVKGKDLLIVGSGVGLAPVRTMIVRALENKQEFGKIVVIASATSYEGLVYKEDLLQWPQIKDVRVFYALSKPTDKVEAHVGYINDLLPDLGLDWGNTTAVICASPRRIKAVAKDLLKLGMKSTDILTSLETHMRCGIGKCGHCKVGSKYMCIDGPVFNYEEMLTLPPEF
jgi:NAD(P)H-flavin reductase/formate hydrogenlyase subunit 6/NADH:ubiquinone oxidoreductase subunit I